MAEFTDRPFTDFSNTELDRLVSHPVIAYELDSFMNILGSQDTLPERFFKFCRDLGGIYAKMSEQHLPSGSIYAAIALPDEYEPVTKQRLANLMEEVKARENLPSPLRDKITIFCTECGLNGQQSGKSR